MPADAVADSDVTAEVETGIRMRLGVASEEFHEDVASEDAHMNRYEDVPADTVSRHLFRTRLLENC